MTWEMDPIGDRSPSAYLRRYIVGGVSYRGLCSLVGFNVPGDDFVKWAVIRSLTLPGPDSSNRRCGKIEVMPFRSEGVLCSFIDWYGLNLEEAIRKFCGWEISYSLTRDYRSGVMRFDTHTAYRPNWLQLYEVWYQNAGHGRHNYRLALTDRAGMQELKRGYQVHSACTVPSYGGPMRLPEKSYGGSDLWEAIG